MSFQGFKFAVRLAVAIGTCGWLTQAADKVELAPREWQAVTLVKLLPYVKWPESALSESDTEFIVGILGEDPFGGLLEKLVKDAKVGGRQVKIRNVDPAEPLGKLQVLFVPVNRDTDWQELSKKLNRSGILTIGVTEDFTKTGGVFHLRSQEHTLIVNLENARKAGLTFDSKLLRICTKER